MLNKDSIIFQTKDREAALSARKEILKNFNRVWVCVYHDLCTHDFSIEVNNTWGGKLPQDQEKEIASFLSKPKEPSEKPQEKKPKKSKKNDKTQS